MPYDFEMGVTRPARTFLNMTKHNSQTPCEPANNNMEYMVRWQQSLISLVRIDYIGAARNKILTIQSTHCFIYLAVNYGLLST